jgi:hypothetical protein
MPRSILTGFFSATAPSGRSSVVGTRLIHRWHGRKYIAGDANRSMAHIIAHVRHPMYFRQWLLEVVADKDI